MKASNILEAEQEAKRFLKRVADLKKQQPNAFKDTANRRTDGSKETGAVKRASMDLTRSLSKLRNDIWS